jgi:hypothetical protein
VARAVPVTIIATLSLVALLATTGCSSGSGKTKAASAKEPFPEGAFVTTVTAADFDRARHWHNIPLPSSYTLTLHDGRWRHVETPTVPDQPPGGGAYVVHRDEVTFITAYPPEAKGVRETLKWSYYRRLLTLRVVTVADSGARLMWSSHPWRRKR